MTPGKAGFKREAQEKRDFSHSFEMTVRGKSGEISLFASRPFCRSKRGRKNRLAPFEMTAEAGRRKAERRIKSRTGGAPKCAARFIFVK